MVRVSHFANADTSVRVTSSSQASPDTASPLDRRAVFLVVPPQPSARASAIRLAVRSRPVTDRKVARMSIEKWSG